MQHGTMKKKLSAVAVDSVLDLLPFSNHDQNVHYWKSSDLQSSPPRVDRFGDITDGRESQQPDFNAV